MSQKRVPRTPSAQQSKANIKPLERAFREMGKVLVVPKSRVSRRRPSSQVQPAPVMPAADLPLSEAVVEAVSAPGFETLGTGALGLEFAPVFESAGSPRVSSEVLLSAADLTPLIDDEPRDEKEPQARVVRKDPVRDLTELTELEKELKTIRAVAGLSSDEEDAEASARGFRTWFSVKAGKHKNTALLLASVALISLSLFLVFITSPVFRPAQEIAVTALTAVGVGIQTIFKAL